MFSWKHIWVIKNWFKLCSLCETTCWKAVLVMWVKLLLFFFFRSPFFLFFWRGFWFWWVFFFFIPNNISFCNIQLLLTMLLKDFWNISMLGQRITFSSVFDSICKKLFSDSLKILNCILLIEFRQLLRINIF